MHEDTKQGLEIALRLAKDSLITKEESSILYMVVAKAITVDLMYMDDGRLSKSGFLGFAEELFDSILPKEKKEVQ